MPKNNLFSILPDEMMIQILQYLDFKTLLNIAVNKRWHNISQEDSVWKSQFTTFGFNSISPSKSIFHSIAQSIMNDKKFNVMLLSNNSQKKCQFTNFCHKEPLKRTMGMDFSMFKLKEICLLVWDTVGNERFKNFNSVLKKKADFFFYFPDNVDDFKDWIEKINKPPELTYTSKIDNRLKKSWCLIPIFVQGKKESLLIKGLRLRA